MMGRFEIRETTSYLLFTQGWQEVLITDRLTGRQASGRGSTYDEAVDAAWRSLKQAEGIATIKDSNYPSESVWQ